MGLFGNPRKNKDKWAEPVVANAQPGMDLEEKFWMLQQLCIFNSTQGFYMTVFIWF